jgi:DNA polymerase-3 subunit beta
MNLTIHQALLSRGLAIVSRAVASRATLPVLANVLLKAEDGKLTFQATNLEIGITTWAPCEVGEAWALTVPARLFADLVGTLPNEPVTLTPNLGTCTLTVKCGKSSTDIKGIDAQEFPPMPKPLEMGSMAVYRSDRFVEMVNRVVFAASTDEARPVLQGVHLHRLDQRITMSATDGFRVSVVTGEDCGPVEKAQTAIIPAATLKTVLAPGLLDGKHPEDILFDLDGSKVIYQGKDWMVTSQTIDGNFPDFHQIVPKSFKTRATLSTAALLTAAKQAELFARNANNVVRLHLVGDCVEVSATAEETGQSDGVVMAEVDGPELTIAFNVSYLRQALEAAKAPVVVLEANDAKGPARLTAQGDAGWFVVMMPMALG